MTPFLMIIFLPYTQPSSNDLLNGVERDAGSRPEIVHGFGTRPPFISGVCRRDGGLPALRDLCHSGGGAWQRAALGLRG
jgi:hypothetical protein